MLPDGRPAGDHGVVDGKKRTIYGGFFEQLLGSEPNDNPDDATEQDDATDTDPTDRTDTTGEEDGDGGTDGGGA